VLWDQYGERVTIRDGDNIYDLLSLEPERLDRPDPTGSRKVARPTKEITKRLKELSDLAVIGGRKALDEYTARPMPSFNARYPQPRSGDGRGSVLRKPRS